MPISAMLRYIPIFFLTGFVLEIASIVWMGGAIGLLPTLLLLIGGGMLGLSLFRSAGVNISTIVSSSGFNASRHKNLASDTLFRVTSGLLFLVPGFFSDLVALMLFVPIVRRWLVSRLGISVSTAGAAGTGFGNQRVEIIDLEAVEIEAEIESLRTDRKRPPSPDGR
jgi:UPF0716 protein FxsA